MMSLFLCVSDEIKTNQPIKTVRKSMKYILKCKHFIIIFEFWLSNCNWMFLFGSYWRQGNGSYWIEDEVGWKSLLKRLPVCFTLVFCMRFCCQSGKENTLIQADWQPAYIRVYLRIISLFLYLSDVLLVLFILYLSSISFMHLFLID